MSNRGRGRPSIKDGEKSSSLSVRVANSQFETIFKLSRQWHVTLPEAVRIKLNAQLFTEDEFRQQFTSQETAHAHLETARAILKESRELFEESRETKDSIVNMLILLSTARSLSEAHYICEHALGLITGERRSRDAK